jgi:hypothetical protein
MAGVFVSYDSRDAARVEDMLALLRDRGLVSGTDVVTDQSLEPGVSLRDTVRKAIQDASSIVVMWTEAAAQSANVNYELGMADAVGKPIVLVNLDGPHRILRDLNNVQVVDLHPAA